MKKVIYTVMMFGVVLDVSAMSEVIGEAQPVETSVATEGLCPVPQDLDEQTPVVTSSIDNEIPAAEGNQFNSSDVKADDKFQDLFGSDTEEEEKVSEKTEEPRYFLRSRTSDVSSAEEEQDVITIRTPKKRRIETPRKAKAKAEVSEVEKTAAASVSIEQLQQKVTELEQANETLRAENEKLQEKGWLRRLWKRFF